MGLGVGFVPVCKPRKLPREHDRESYELEYGIDALELHKDSIKPGNIVRVVEDLLATGGTIEAAIKLICRAGGEVKHAAFIINLFDLSGKDLLNRLGIDCYSLVNLPSH